MVRFSGRGSIQTGRLRLLPPLLNTHTHTLISRLMPVPNLFEPKFWFSHKTIPFISYRIACNFRGVKISFNLKKKIFVSKNFVFRAAVEGGGARLGFSWVKNFVEVSSLTKITKFLPHENYTLYGTRSPIPNNMHMYNNLDVNFIVVEMPLAVGDPTGSHDPPSFWYKVAYVFGSTLIIGTMM